MSDFVLANDIGGTHITSTLIDTNNWKIQDQYTLRADVDALSDKDSILEFWSGVMKECLKNIPSPSDQAQIGIAMPGPFDYEKGISLMQSQNKYDALYGVDVKKELVQRLSTPHILFINDAAAFLQGEVFYNRLTDHDKILGITLGTGLGSAVWTKGEKAFDADLWNSPYKDSIFEEHMVTRFLVRRFEELSGFAEKGFKEIIENHREKEEFKQLIGEYAHHIADFLHFFSTEHGANHFIIGGSIAKAWDLITKDYPHLFRPFTIQTGEIDEEAALIGAATLFE